jgi:hypothetical protein
MERGFSPQMSNTIVLLTDGRQRGRRRLSLAELVKRLKALTRSADPDRAPSPSAPTRIKARCQQSSAAKGGRRRYRANSAADIQRSIVSSLARRTREQPCADRGVPRCGRGSGCWSAAGATRSGRRRISRCPEQVLVAAVTASTASSNASVLARLGASACR